MPLDPELVHPTLASISSALTRRSDLANLELPKPQLLSAQTIVALLGSARMPDELREYVGVLNAALDAQARGAPILEPLAAARDAARALESARSGMAGDLALDRLRLALDDIRAATKLG